MESQYLELALRFTRQVYYYCYLLRHERIMRGIFTDFFILLLPHKYYPAAPSLHSLSRVILFRLITSDAYLYERGQGPGCN